MTITKNITTSLTTPLTKTLIGNPLILPITSGLIMQLTAFQDGKTKSQLVTVDGIDAVSDWLDLSGNSKDAVQMTSSNQPTFTENAINSHPALNFTTNDYLDIPFSADLNPSSLTIFVVCKVTGGAGTFRSPITSRNSPSPNIDGYIIYAGNGNNWEGWVGSGTAFGGVMPGAIAVTIDENVIVTNDVTNGAQTLRINGSEAGTATSTYIVNSVNPTRIGAGATEDPPGFFFEGLIGEVILYNSVLSSIDQAMVESYLAAKWSIPL